MATSRTKTVAAGQSRKPRRQAKATDSTPAVTTNAAAGRREPPDKYRVRIRMYRQGIGDSFLLSFSHQAGTAHMLVDCGVLVGTKNAKQWAENIAADVLKETGGNLGAVVGTHPHWDHLSGFADAQSTFKTFTGIGEVWMAWSEDPKDPTGRAVSAKHTAQLAALQLALAHLAGLADEQMRADAASVADLTAFLGLGDGMPAFPAAGGSRTQGAVDALRALSTVVKYRNPGDLLNPDWLPGVRIYVLGPPRDEKLLGTMLSSKPGDLYALGSDAGFIAALNATTVSAAGPAGTTAWDAQCPFDSTWLFDPATAAANVEFLPVTTRYLAADAAWRTIDAQWLLSAEALALQLDNAINNLSLVLAFEFIDSGDVLLFPADAQVGNWQSWQSLIWKVRGADGVEREVRAKDLLARTVFYKVGHHGSHNATLQNGGLEDMSHPGLTAAIPVNELFAKGSKHWEMPAGAMYQRLQERTEGRVMRSDGTGPYALAADATLTQNSAGKAFADNVFVDTHDPPLYVDYYLP